MKILVASAHKVERLGVVAVLNSLLVDIVRTVEVDSIGSLFVSTELDKDIELLILDLNTPHNGDGERLLALTSGVSALRVIGLDGGDGDRTFYGKWLGALHMVSKTSPLVVFADAVLALTDSRLHRIHYGIY